MIRIGHGYDVHRLVRDRDLDLILGGVKIPYDLGLLGHSDADVLVHAVMDALLGSLALGDIGKHFPDTDQRYSGISSLKLLSHVSELIKAKGCKVGNIDCTVIAQSPKLAPFIETMRENIASALDCDVEKISVKATTEEGLGFTGLHEGIAAHAVCLVENR
jgi:2-C-methyl-D-erythritol 2,4-cyclodiphosphate synthase